MIQILAKMHQAQVTYPLSLVWVTGAVVAVGVSLLWFSLGVGLLLLSVTSLLIYMVSLRREVKQVHRLVNSQRDELLDRINALTAALTVAGVTLPAGETSEAARVQPTRKRMSSDDSQ